MATPNETLIAKRAYELWEKQGRQHGFDKDHWHQAAAELTANGKPKPGAAAKAPKAKAAGTRVSKKTIG